MRINSEQLMESFYIDYLLNDPQARKDIGLKHSSQLMDGVLRPYVRYGFTAVPAEFRNDHRNKAKAKLALGQAKSAWLQHLKRSIPDLKQITVFIERETYDLVQDFREKKIDKGQYGHGISQDGVIEDLLKAGLRTLSGL